MHTVNVGKLIEVFELDEENLAQHLFPLNKHPKSALKRIISGDSLLDTDQLFKLSRLVNLSVEDLFFSDGWKTAFHDQVHVLTFEEYEAHLNVDTWVTTIFHKGSMLHEAVIHTGSISLSYYLELLNNKIEEING